MVKRAFDIGFSFLLLLLTSPLFFFCIAIIKFFSKGPIFYAHPRIGLHGKPFSCWKFRTMQQDADARLKPLLAENPLLLQEWSTYSKLKMDPRITRIGSFLRTWSFDELPQLWNVLKGEMSIVGPRPLTAEEVASHLQDRSKTILSLRPGLTNLWIVKGRNLLSLKERIEWEEFYVANRSFWLDCKLIVQTLFCLFFQKGAF